MLVLSPRIRANLRAIASMITSNSSDHDDVLQEMLIHLWKSERSNPGQTESWYLQNCKYFGMDYMKRGKSVDGKRRANCVLLSMDQETPEGQQPLRYASNRRDFREQLFASDALALLKGRLTKAQQLLLDAFANGESVSEVSQALGCSHQYVSKQRKKIALALATMLT